MTTFQADGLEQSIRYIVRPGSDLFVVFNKGYDRDRALQELPDRVHRESLVGLFNFSLLCSTAFILRRSNARLLSDRSPKREVVWKMTKDSSAANRDELLSRFLRIA